MGTHLYRFFDLITDIDAFHVKSNWFHPTKLDLDDTSADQDNHTECCHITVRNYSDYYTCTITRDLLLHNFKENDVFKGQKNDILQAAFQGEPSYKNSIIQWKASKSEANSQLKMELQIVNNDVPLTLGSFDLVKAQKDQVQDLKRQWFEHLDLSSTTDIEINKTLKQNITDIEKTNREYRKKIESINNTQKQERHVAIDKFLRLLNTKKEKIYQLQKQVQQQKHQLGNTLQDSDGELSAIESSTIKPNDRNKQKTSRKIEQTKKSTQKRSRNKGKRPIRHKDEDEYDSEFENKFKLEEDFTIAGPSKKKQKTKYDSE